MAQRPLHKRGGPTKSTPEVQAVIVIVIQEGNFRDVAAGCARISPETLSRWMNSNDPNSPNFDTRPMWRNLRRKK